jgi:hypothetical protein
LIPNICHITLVIAALMKDESLAQRREKISVMASEINRAYSTKPVSQPCTRQIVLHQLSSPALS